jgi:hypothetical protein
LTRRYDRNAQLRTFEPFRQGDRNDALISPNYTATSVMDLQTGEIVAGEEPSPRRLLPPWERTPELITLVAQSFGLRSVPTNVVCLR